jgi:hypothetical protein
MYDLKMVDIISNAEIRNILLKNKIKWRKSKTVLSNKSNDSEYDLKKVYIYIYTTIMIQNTHTDSVLPYEKMKKDQ